jgi:hypothetical protein
LQDGGQDRGVDRRSIVCGGADRHPGIGIDREPIDGIMRLDDDEETGDSFVHRFSLALGERHGGGFCSRHCGISCSFLCVGAGTLAGANDWLCAVGEANVAAFVLFGERIGVLTDSVKTP